MILFRLRTGHNRLNAHMYNKFKVGESKACPCKANIITAEHLLQHCQLLDALGRDMWPEPTLLKGKLYGKPGGPEEDNRFGEGDRHLHLVYDDDEEKDMCIYNIRPACEAKLYNIKPKQVKKILMTNGQSVLRTACSFWQEKFRKQQKKRD